MIPALVVFAYLAVVLYIGIFAFRTSRKSSAEDYFLAGRSLGPTVFLLSLFGTNMTAFSILGASGHAFANGIVTFGLMASSSALVIPVCLFAIGTRLWALGKRNHFMTPVQMFRDRWECRHIGTVIFIVQAALLVPYIIIAVMGGGTVLRAITNGFIPYELGGAIVSSVVMAYVFLGGMRGTAWVNALQTTLFLLFGTIAVFVIGAGMGGFREAMEALLASPDDVTAADSRAGLAAVFLQLHVHPALVDCLPAHLHLLSDGSRREVLPQDHRALSDLHAVHLAALCVSGGCRESGDGRPSHSDQARGAGAARHAKRDADARGPRTPARPGRRRRCDPATGGWICAAVARCAAGGGGDGRGHGQRFADSRVVDDVHRRHRRVLSGPLDGARGRPTQSQDMQVMTGRIFVVLVTAVAYLIALRIPQSIFDVATQYAFAGYAALVPLLVAALFWKNSTRWGALATTLWTAAAVMTVAVIQNTIAAPPPGTSIVVWAIGDQSIVTRGAAGTFVMGMLPVVPMTLDLGDVDDCGVALDEGLCEAGRDAHSDATSLT